MDPWSSVSVPILPPGAPVLRLFDTARGSVEPTGSAWGERSVYVCGITPYDATHLGHAATMITFDLVNRVWRDAGHEVRFVTNATDVDDPLLERARRDGVDWVELARQQIALFHDDMVALRVLPPAHYVGAVESIPGIVSRVDALLSAGAAYRVDTDVYFDVAAAPRFGYESGLGRPEMLALAKERGGDPDRAGKRDPLDPLLWRGRREGEPFWDGGPELGEGRPGWHIECAEIALSRLGPTIDVQGGGSDLIFPHHECSAAHAEVLTGEHPFARHFVHAGMIGLDGVKMSKSLGNLVLVSRLCAAGTDPMAVRLGLLAGHYRADRSWDDSVLATAQQRLARWRAALARGTGPSSAALLTGVREALADDLDTPRALSIVDEWATAALAEGGPSPSTLVGNVVDALLGVAL